MPRGSYGWVTSRIRLSLLAAVLGILGATSTSADILITSQTNNYAFGVDAAAISIKSEVFIQGANFLWKYTVTNNSYAPDIPEGPTNGFSGFELNLPGFVADFGNATAPSALWETNCCSGLPIEWDLKPSDGLGIMPGFSGVFSFTTLPRLITTAETGWFHTWVHNDQFGFDNQEAITYYGADNAPLAPDVLSDPLPPAVPEPGTLFLLGFGGMAILVNFRRNRKKKQ